MQCIVYLRHKALGNQASLVLLIQDFGIWERDTEEQAYAGMFTDLGWLCQEIGSGVKGEVEAADLALQYIILVGEKNNACKECIMLLVEAFTHLHEYSQGFLI